MANGGFYSEMADAFVICQKENGNMFTLFIIFIVKSLQKEQNNTNISSEIENVEKVENLRISVGRCRKAF